MTIWSFEPKVGWAQTLVCHQLNDFADMRFSPRARSLLRMPRRTALQVIKELVAWMARFSTLPPNVAPDRVSPFNLPSHRQGGPSSIAVIRLERKMGFLVSFGIIFNPNIHPQRCELEKMFASHRCLRVSQKHSTRRFPQSPSRNCGITRGLAPTSVMFGGISPFVGGSS